MAAISGYKASKNNRLITPSVLRTVAGRMYPCYRKIAFHAGFAIQWSRAVRAVDTERMEKLLRKASPKAGSPVISANRIGYFIAFDFPKPIYHYTSATTIPPGTAKSPFNTRAHRRIARSVLPLYRKLATDRSFAQAFTKAVRRSDRAAVSRMVRSRVRTYTLRSVIIEDSGPALMFKYSFTKDRYRHLLFQSRFP